MINTLYDRMSEKSNKPLVSVIVSCYNYGEYVGQMIDSVLNQTYENIELVLLDNGSTDNSYDVIKGYGDKIHCLLHVEKNDVNYAGELLRKNVNGEYIAFMTADDYWYPEKIEKQMQILINKPEVCACFTWIHTIDEQGNIVYNSSHNAFEHKNRARNEWMEKLIMQGNCFAYPSAVVTKDIYFTSYTNRYYQMGDKYLWMRILLSREVYVIEEPLTCVRWHPKSKVANVSAMNAKTLARTMSEEVMSSKDIITRMDDRFFVQTFGKYMRDANAVSHEQILCEKFFLLMKMAETKKGFEHAAISFYYEQDVLASGCYFILATALMKYYGYSFLDFQDYCAAHGIGYWQLQMNQTQELKKIIQRQQMFLCALRETVKTDFNTEDRQKLYRKMVFQQLDANVKELVEATKGYIRDVLALISNSSDEEIEAGLSGIIANISHSSTIFDNLWEVFLCQDDALNEVEWQHSMTILKNETVDAEAFCDIIIPFIVQLYEVLILYSE